MKKRYKKKPIIADVGHSRFITLLRNAKEVDMKVSENKYLLNDILRRLNAPSR